MPHHLVGALLVVAAMAAAGDAPSFVRGARADPTPQETQPDSAVALSAKQQEVVELSRRVEILMFGEVHPAWNNTKDRGDDSPYHREEKWLSALLPHLDGYAQIGLEIQSKLQPVFDRYAGSNSNEGEAKRHFVRDILKESFNCHIEDGKMVKHSGDVWLRGFEESQGMELEEVRPILLNAYLQLIERYYGLIKAAKENGFEVICMDDLTSRGKYARSDLSESRQKAMADTLMQKKKGKVLTFGGESWLTRGLYTLLKEEYEVGRVELNLGTERRVQGADVVHVDDLGK